MDVKCNFNGVSERDMDTLFLEAFATDKGFAELFLNKTNIDRGSYFVEKVELSKTDAELGESDITVYLNRDGHRYTLLIEDKINAIAMPEQHKRYVERGEKGIADNEYDEYRIFIVCPKKYYTGNDEAKKYEHVVFYEECLEYFESKNDDTAKVRVQQIEQAVSKSKSGSNVTINHDANAFLKEYIKYQKEKYPELELRTKDTANGYWVEYKTTYVNGAIFHKTDMGVVDLTFYHMGNEMSTMKMIELWLREHGTTNITAEKTSGSASLRIAVPVINIKELFSECDKDDLKTCFDAIAQLHKLSLFIGNLQRVVE